MEVSKGWLHEILLYIPHFLIATLGILVVSFLLGFMVAAVIGDTLADEFFAGPIYIVPVALGFVAGLVANRLMPTRLAFWVWIPPAVLLLWTVKVYEQAGGLGSVARDLFGTACGGCEEQVMVVCPFYISLAYSVAAWFVFHRTVGRKRDGAPGET